MNNSQNRIINLEDFFDFKSKEPINRLAYTEEDLKYKVKIIKAMQKLGMNITIDKIGNICGNISLGKSPKKTLVIGSHTDSVYDGGQYDGPVGVISGLQVAEKLIKSGKCNGILKIAIYTCEESSRFGNACLGSKYLNGNIDEKDFNNIVDQKNKNITLKDCIEYAKSYFAEHIENYEEVDKIFDEVDYSLESHIEQYELLKQKAKKLIFFEKPVIGIINSIGSAVRIKYDVQGKSRTYWFYSYEKKKKCSKCYFFYGNLY